MTGTVKHRGRAVEKPRKKKKEDLMAVMSEREDSKGKEGEVGTEVEHEGRVGLGMDWK